MLDLARFRAERGAALCLLCLTTALASSPALVFAQSTGTSHVSAGAGDAKPPTGYETAVNLAFREFELGNYPEARTRFLEAHKLFPSARTHRALAMVEYELKNYGDAIEQAELALDSKVRPLEGQMRAEAEDLLARAKGYVARVNLEVNPGAATVVLDGTPLQIAAGGTLLLQVGDHNLEFRAPGRLPETRRLKVNGGEEQTLHVALAPAVEARAPAKQPARKPLLKNPWLWAAVGVVVVGAAAGTAIGLTAGGTKTQTGEPYTGNAGAAVLRAP